MTDAFLTIDARADRLPNPPAYIAMFAQKPSPLGVLATKGYGALSPDGPGQPYVLPREDEYVKNIAQSPALVAVRFSVGSPAHTP